MKDQGLDWEFLKIQEDFFRFTIEQPVSIECIGKEASFFQAKPVKAFIQFGAENNEKLDDIVKSFCKISEMDFYYGCLTGYLIGLYGESDIFNSHTDYELADFFIKAVNLCIDYVELSCKQLGILQQTLNEEENGWELLERVDKRKLALENIEAVKAWEGISLLSLGLMSRIARQFPMREQLRQAGQLVSKCQFLDGFRKTVGFVPWILNMVEKETVLLLSPKTGYGVEAALEEIDSNNLFFTLLQFALYHKGLLEKLQVEDFTYNPIIERIAKHEPVAKEEWPETLYETGYFSYYTYQAYQQDGGYDQMKVVWGEGNLYEVPKLENRFIILIDKPYIKRTWGNAFVCSTHEGLQPKVEILRELTKDEVSEWMEKIRSAVRSKTCK